MENSLHCWTMKKIFTWIIHDLKPSHLHCNLSLSLSLMHQARARTHTYVYLHTYIHINIHTVIITSLHFNDSNPHPPLTLFFFSSFLTNSSPLVFLELRPKLRDNIHLEIKHFWVTNVWCNLGLYGNYIILWKEGCTVVSLIKEKIKIELRIFQGRNLSD
jgi:hypothetical protein